MEPGDIKTVEVTLALKYAGSYWDEERNMWVLERGFYNVVVGDLKGQLEVKSTKWWNGL
jgi:beta-glucosidase